MKKQSGLIDMIHPTQIAVGYSEVAVKMNELVGYEKDGTLEDYLKEKTIPCVLGPDNIAYITDHHHMGLALTVLAQEWDNKNIEKNRQENPFIHCMFSVEHNFSKSKLNKKDFFKVLSSLNLLHDYDEFGKKSKIPIPNRLIDLKNDPYRALAGFVRKSGGYKKIRTPYIEFIWADFFRERITREDMDKNFKKCVIKGISLALSDDAKNLPGFKGVEILNGLKEEFINKIHENKKQINKSASNLEEKIEETKTIYPIQKPLKFKK